MHDDNISSFAAKRKPPPQSTITLSALQQEVIENVVEELRRPSTQYVHVDGLAGTGKTELAIYLRRYFPDARFVAYTGKAASVLRLRGAENATTIHSLLYGSPTIQTHKYGKSLRWHLRHEKITASVIIADECSMIAEPLGRDLIATGVKVLVTGDSFQLPPVKGDPFFTDPDYILTEVHRQAAGSQPLRLATAIRKGRQAKPQPYDIDAILDADIVVCAFEKTRRYLNQIIRRAKGIKGQDPIVGDRVCCFRSNADHGVLNGTIWSVTGVEEVTEKVAVPNSEGGMRSATQYLYRLQLVDDLGTVVSTLVPEEYFNADPRDAPYDQEWDVFSFGYCLTCHKSQASEWDRVAVIDETHDWRFPRIIGNLTLAEYQQRWLYTGVTRAKTNVVLMEPPA